VSDANSKRKNESGSDDQRDDRLHIRVNAAEKRRFERLAAARHTDLSEIVRQALHKEADIEFSKAKA
jgi:predicted transcriptional regulator